MNRVSCVERKEKRKVAFKLNKVTALLANHRRAEPCCPTPAPLLRHHNHNHPHPHHDISAQCGAEAGKGNVTMVTLYAGRYTARIWMRAKWLKWGVNKSRPVCFKQTCSQSPPPQSNVVCILKSPNKYKLEPKGPTMNTWLTVLSSRYIVLDRKSIPMVAWNKTWDNVRWQHHGVEYAHATWASRLSV